MTRHPALLLSTSLLVAACAPARPPSWTRAEPTEPPALEVTIAPDAVPVFKPQLKPLPKVDGKAATSSGLAAIKVAHQAALIQSAPDGFINASQLYAFADGAVYELHAAPAFVSTVLLQPGEQLISYAAGDTARWIIDEVNKQDQALLLIKPTRPGLRTNFVITTDKRIYLLEAASHEGDIYNAFIAWTYPTESLSTKVAAVEAENDRRADIVVAGVPVDQLNFDYRIDGDHPRWRPVRAFDDGGKVYIEFPAELATSEAPPLFVTEDSGDNQLVNYRVKNRYYVVDRLFSRAELRLDGTVVQIRRGGGVGAFWDNPWSDGSGEQRLRRDPDDRDNRSYGGNAGKWR